MNLCDPGAECSVLGSIILDNDVFDEVVALGLDADSFGMACHRQVFAAMQEMVQVGQAIDLVTLRNKLSSENRLEAVGGVAWLMSLIDNIPAVSNIKHYVEIVLERSRSRRLHGAMIEGAQKLKDGGKASDVSSILSDAIEATLPRVTLDQGMVGALIQRGMGLNKAKSFPWGWRWLDKRTGGIPGAALTIIGAYPGVGKTALATAMITKLAKGNIACALFSTEMSATQIIQTILGRESGVGPSRLRSRGIDGLDDESVERLTRTKHEIEKLPLYILAGPASASEVTAHARALRRKHKIELVVVDYLQLLKRAGKEESRRLGIDAAVQALKGLAQQTSLSVVLLSQLARDRGHEDRPTGALLKESGGIHETADLILLLTRPKFRQTEACSQCTQPGNTQCPECGGDGEVSQDNEMIVHIEKNRFGDAGSHIGLGWDGRLMQVTNWKGDSDG